MQEIELNQQKPLPKSQLEFWAAPSSSPFTAFTRRPSHHDPRGCPAYVRDHILPFSKTRDGLKLGGSSLAFWRAPSGSSNGADSSSNGGTSAGAGAVVPRHRPHPNIVDSLFGVVQAVSLTPQEQAERLKAMSAEDLEEGACGGILGAENGTVPVRDNPVKGKQFKVNIISGEANDDSDGFEDDDRETRERKWRE
ncbi:hypothetical protein PoB_002401600 [Plakobranchus ocellatus]|uniref:Uncharacterized protein n=1 Tax=Plakobranchus ocellatus TaxID=259542 RepID=A0AAV3ZSN9_9GAST|nr:hypothetical protein PoB_002401600 [Plakobranchus ocellatus]